MDIQEVKEERARLEAQIADLVKGFHERTGVKDLRDPLETLVKPD